MLKKYGLVLITLLSINSGKAQSFLTNGQVYNFDVGDVIQSKKSLVGSIAPPTFITLTVLTKSISINSDTLTYTIDRIAYQPFYSYFGGIIHDTTTMIINNLNSAVTFSNLSDPCVHMTDTLYTNSCQRLVYENRPEYPGCGFEPNWETMYFIAGLGGPYYYRYISIANPPEQSAYELNYYSKKSGTCGSFVPTSIEENTAFINRINIFSNPVGNSLTIRSEQTFQDFKIVDVNGIVCLRGKLDGKSINTEALSSGVYFLHVYSATAVGSAKIVKE